MKSKLWINLFIKIAAIFAVFVAVIILANSTLLTAYFTHKEKNLLIEHSASLAALDPTDTDAVSQKIEALVDSYNFDVEIYQSNGRIIYTTRGSKMMDYINSGLMDFGFTVNHERLVTERRQTLPDGAVVETARSSVSGEEFLLCKRTSAEGITTELRVQTDILKNSAQAAGEFIIIIALVCFILSMVWVFLFSRRFSRPISEMSEITENMAELNFSRKVEVGSKDEIGRLGNSINDLSDRLDAALFELRESNARLQNEIELERRLDVMRRGFVANVSHELKTPLAIISGYAEGLKLNINSASKDAYCDTIIDETQRMNRLVRGILELSKYEAAGTPRHQETVDIAAMAGEMLERIAASRQDITATCEIEAGTTITADPAETEQVLKSFTENAVAHVKAGGNIRIWAEDEAELLRISVFNSGDPIDPEIMPRIWESFFRGETHHNRDEGRFGLGLSIVSAIIKAQGQRCGVYNAKDGVCFWFTCRKEQ